MEETMKNGRKAIKGKCPTCGVVMFKILGGKAAVATAPAAKTPEGQPSNTPAKAAAATVGEAKPTAQSS